MKKLTRAISTGGLGLLAALAIGVGPAQAVNTTGAQQARPAPQPFLLNDGIQVAGFYSSFRACAMAGRFGERNGNWDDYRCEPVRTGVRGTAWALQVVSYDNWDRIGFDSALRAVCAFPSQFRPMWAGQYGPGRPARVFKRHPGRAIHGHPGRIVYGTPGGGGDYSGRSGMGDGPRSDEGPGPQRDGAPGGPRGGGRPNR